MQENTERYWREKVEKAEAEAERLRGRLRYIIHAKNEWDANKLGGVSVQRRRWQQLGEIAHDALYPQELAPAPRAEGGDGMSELPDYNIKANRLALLDKLIEGLERKDTDKALMYLLKAFRLEVCELLYIDKSWYPEWFHKAFRQIDVVSVRGVDMVFYQLIENASDKYWRLFDGIVTAEARKYYDAPTPQPLDEQAAT